MHKKQHKIERKRIKGKTRKSIIKKADHVFNEAFPIKDLDMLIVLIN